MRIVALVVVVLAVAAGLAYGLWVTPTGKPDDYAGNFGTSVRQLFGLTPRTADKPVEKDIGAVVAPPPKDPPKVAAPPDLGEARASVTWRMKTCKNAPGCNENGVTKTCGELGVKELRFVIENEKTGELIKRHVACPPQQSEGEVALALPKGEGPWTLTGASDDVASARTEVVCHMTRPCWSRNFSLSIYAKGCMDPECLSCLEGTHTLGWCE